MTDKHLTPEELRRFAEWDASALEDPRLAAHVAWCVLCAATIDARRRGEARLAAAAEGPSEEWQQRDGEGEAGDALRLTSEEEFGLAHLAVASEPPAELWEEIVDRARRGIRAVPALRDIDPGYGNLREVEGRDAEQGRSDEPTVEDGESEEKAE